MILFQNDWLKYPDAIIDYKTSNKTALNLAVKYRLMGIKNNAFFLSLLNPGLSGVDPFSEELTLDQMVAIAIECKQNPWYYFREIARAPSNAGVAGSLLEFNRANIALWWSFFNHATFILTQPRQTGKSFCSDLLMTCLYNFYCSNTQINLLTAGDVLRKKNIERLKLIYDELPTYLNFKQRDDSNNTEEITIRKYNNTYTTHVPQASEKGAYKLGRGLTTAIIQVDEAPFQPNIEAAFSTAMGAMGAAIAQAKEKQEPYGVLLTTTAGKKDDRDGRYVYNYCQEAALWSELFFDCEDAEAFETMVRRNSRSAKDSKRGVFRIYGSFTHTQLGKTDDWLRDQLERTASTPEQANRDFFNIWTSGTESSPLKTSVLELLNRSIVEPKHQQISSIGGYITRWYIEEHDIPRYMATKKCVIGIDTSDASGGDDISFVLTDVETGGVVAIGTYNETNLIKFAQWLLAWLVEYDNCTMIIERRSTGATIIDYLLMFLPQKGIDPFTRLFSWIVQDHVENKDKYEQALLPLGRRPEDLYVTTKKSFGFATSGGGQTSRTELYSTTLQNATRRCAVYVRDRSLTDQITGLVSRNGRIDHDVGGHDDLVIGWLLTHWFLTMGKNLAHYGIDSSTVLSARAYVENQTPSEIYFSNLQQSIRSQIKELFVIMKNEENSDMHYRHEQRLRNLNAQLVLKDGEFFSIDAMLAQIKADKTKPVSKQSYVRFPINPNYVRMN